MLVHLCLFVLLSLMSHIVYVCKIIFEQINDDDDDDDDGIAKLCYGKAVNNFWQKAVLT